MFILRFLCCCLSVVLSTALYAQERVILGNEQTHLYFPLLQGKRVALFSNHTGMLGDKHLLDVMVDSGLNVTAVFSPEHGFRGDADAGEHVKGSVDKKTGVPILSLYDGKTGRPGSEAMQRFDVLVVDIQDVGLRFYTYYISMCRLMEACAQHNLPVLVLDRPNPNGHYVDGPLLDMKYRSGVGWLPIPVVHGMTLGELALMINGEGWLPDGRQCKLQVVRCLHYTHRTRYDLPVAPSPNLPTMKAVYLYPSLCFFEATPVSLGRGTDLPFQIYGHPAMKGGTYRFTPRSKSGAKNPPLLGQLCHGFDLSQLSDSCIWQRGVDLFYLIDAYKRLKMGHRFFTPFFEKLIGQAYVRRMILQGCSAEEIRSRWREDVERFKAQRRPYLLYEE